MTTKFFGGVFQKFKHAFGCYGKNKLGLYEYYIQLSGYYFSRSKNVTIAVLQIRNKRLTIREPIQNVLSDREILKQLHPEDACILGILANNDRNNIIDKTCVGLNNMKLVRQNKCLVKSEPILMVKHKYFTSDKEEITVLYSPCLKKEITVKTIDLLNNQALLYALGSIQAISVGYDISEARLNN